MVVAGGWGGPRGGGGWGGGRWGRKCRGEKVAVASQRRRGGLSGRSRRGSVSVEKAHRPPQPAFLARRDRTKLRPIRFRPRMMSWRNSRNRTTGGPMGFRGHPGPDNPRTEHTNYAACWTRVSRSAGNGRPIGSGGSRVWPGTPTPCAGDVPTGLRQTTDAIPGLKAPSKRTRRPSHPALTPVFVVGATDQLEESTAPGGRAEGRAGGRGAPQNQTPLGW